METKNSKVLSSGMHVAHCTTYMLDEAPQPTAWLDVTKSDGGLCVAWNGARYLLTTEQARRMVETLASLLADPPTKEATK